MSYDGVISLDSDDDNATDLNALKNTDVDPIEILSDDDDDLSVVKSKSETMSKPITETNPIEDVNFLNEKPGLTAQALLRQKLAGAAEKRLKRSLDTTEDLNMLPNKTPKIEPPSQPNITISNASQPIQIKAKLIDTSVNDRSSRIRMIGNAQYCSEFGVDGDKDSVSLSDLVGSKDLIKTYQFNMLIDFDYLKKFITNDKCEFHLINNANDDFLHVSDYAWENYNIKSIDVSNKLPKFGSHHTKLMVNFYKDSTCQIVVHTMNMTEADHLIQTQMCWVSPQLEIHDDVSKYLDFNQPNLSIKTDTGTVFKRDFIAYLLSYENNDINKLIDQIGKYDFSPIDVVFVASTPGHYQYDNWNNLTNPDAKPLFGYGRLWQVIHMLKLQSLSGRLVGQASTIAGPCDNWKRNILVYLLTSCAEKGYPMIKKADYRYKPGKNKLEPMIIWPTEKEVLSSKAGPLSGIALHFTTSGKWPAYQRQFDDVKEHLYKWTTNSNTPHNSKSGRSNLSPHVKTYTVTEDNFKTMKWFLMTSANISHQAWGKYKAYNLFEYDISSFEAGIFVAPELLKVSNKNNQTPILVPTYGKDTVDDASSLSGGKIKIGIRLPYDTPLTKHSQADVPWTQPNSDRFFQ